PGYSVYLRKTDGSPAVRLGEGAAGTLSPDGKWALSLIHVTSQPQLVVLPTGAGEPRKLPTEGLFPLRGDWLPGGKGIVVTANEPGRGARLYGLDVSGGQPRAISPEGYRSFLRSVSPDGKFVASQGPDRRVYLYPLNGGEPTPLPDLSSRDIPIRWRDAR